MFSKDQDLEKQAGFAEPAEEECRELPDEALDAVAGGGAPPFGSSTKACEYCGSPQPDGWEGESCYYCGYAKQPIPHF